MALYRDSQDMFMMGYDSGYKTACKDWEDMFMMGYDSGYKTACKDWEEMIDKIEETIKRRMSDYDDRNISEYEDCLAIIDEVVGKEKE